LVCTFIVTTLWATAAYAASATVTLYPDQFSTHSAAVGLYKTGLAFARADSMNLLSVYCTLEYAEPGKGWAKKYEKLMPPGGSAYSGTYSVSVAGSWRCGLNVWSIFRGCYAWGAVQAP
ncbi:MAG: hypothetical protein N3B11_07965, partial [Coriobacteriia bacterium]|nr:hypothetical protein [Coriobacteriia bacterium]